MLWPRNLTTWQRIVRISCGTLGSIFFLILVLNIEIPTTTIFPQSKCQEEQARLAEEDYRLDESYRELKKTQGMPDLGLTYPHRMLFCENTSTIFATLVRFGLQIILVILLNFGFVWLVSWSMEYYNRKTGRNSRN